MINDQAKERPVSDLAITSVDYGAPVDVDPLQSQRFSYFVRAAGPIQQITLCEMVLMKLS